MSKKPVRSGFDEWRSRLHPGTPVLVKGEGVCRVVSLYEDQLTVESPADPVFNRHYSLNEVYCGNANQDKYDYYVPSWRDNLKIGSLVWWNSPDPARVGQYVVVMTDLAGPETLRIQRFEDERPTNANAKQLFPLSALKAVEVSVVSVYLPPEDGTHDPEAVGQELKSAIAQAAATAAQRCRASVQSVDTCSNVSNAAQAVVERLDRDEIDRQLNDGQRDIDDLTNEAMYNAKFGVRHCAKESLDRVEQRLCDSVANGEAEDEIEHAASIGYNWTASSTLLEQAVEEGELGALRALIKLSVPQSHLNIGVINAGTKGQVEAAEVLLAAGADLGTVGEDSLCAAIREGRANMVSWLLSHGVSAKSGEVDEARQTAISEEHNEVLAVLAANERHLDLVSSGDASAGRQPKALRANGRL